jgi:hypothetical protein
MSQKFIIFYRLSNDIIINVKAICLSLPTPQSDHFPSDAKYPLSVIAA